MNTRAFLRMLLAFLFVFSAAFARAEEKITYEGGDGSTLEKAVVIKGATAFTGIQAEYAYIRKHFPGSKVNGQKLLHKDDKSYDEIIITTAEGVRRSVFFDITDFFGKGN